MTQNRDVAAKVGMRKGALAEVDPGHWLYVPFCGDGVMAKECGYPLDRTVAVDNDGAAVEHPFWNGQAILADAKKTPPPSQHYGLADFDAYSSPWHAGKLFFESARYGPELQTLWTWNDQARARQNRMWDWSRLTSGEKHRVRCREQRARFAEEAAEWIDGLTGGKSEVRETAKAGTAQHYAWITTRGIPARVRVVSEAPVESLRLTSARQFFGAVEAGKTLHGLATGGFSLCDAIVALGERLPGSHLTLGTWTAAPKEVERLKAALDREIFRTVRVAVDHSQVKLKPSNLAALREAFPGDVRVWSCHAKFAVLIGGEFDVAIITSANLSRNDRVEHYTVLTDQTTVNNYLQIAEALWSDYDAARLDADDELGRLVTERIVREESLKPGKGPNALAQYRARARDKAADRRVEVWRRRLRGQSIRQIAAEIGSDPTTVWRDHKTTLKALTRHAVDDAIQWRTLQLARYEHILNVALGGVDADLNTAIKALNSIDRLMNLVGPDAVTAVQVNVQPQGEPQAVRFIEQLGLPAAAADAGS